MLHFNNYVEPSSSDLSLREKKSQVRKPAVQWRDGPQCMVPPPARVYDLGSSMQVLFASCTWLWLPLVLQGLRGNGAEPYTLIQSIDLTFHFADASLTL